jgi:hypothetical protein
VEVRGKLEEELAVITSLVQDMLHHDDGYPRMHVRKSGEVMVDGDKLDIDYQPNTANDMAVFAHQITDELGRSSMNVMGSLHARRQRLREQLINEQRVMEISRQLVESEPKDKAMYLILQAVVHILNLENPVGLKSIESILCSGLSNAMKGILEWMESNGQNKRQQEYVNHMSSIIQTKILGTVTAPSQWRFPLTEEGNMGVLLRWTIIALVP